MSDNWIKLIPRDPNYQPTVKAAKSARDLLASFVPDADEVDFSFMDEVEFVDPLGNWSGVRCYACGADAEPWWREAYGKGFPELTMKAGCCGASVSLNELEYVYPAGFAKFVLEAMNPNVKDLKVTQMKKLSQCLGCDLRRIWVHL
jgi:hypothetical protein